MSRRPVARLTRGRIAAVAGAAAPAPPATPVTIFGSPNLHWLRADLGITTVGSNVTAWADQGGTLKDFTEATNPPLYSATGGPNNKPYVEGDGVLQQLLSATFALGDPSVTNVYMWLVAYQVSWTSNEDLISGTAGGTAMAIRQSVSTPRVAMMSSAAANTITTFPLTTWGALKALFTGSVSDSFQLNNSAAVTGASAGVTACTGRRLFTNRNSSAWTATRIAEHGIFVGTPTPQQKTDLYNYHVTQFGLT